MTEGIWADIYVLVDDRSIDRVRAFLDRFLPNREEMADEYEVPQYSDEPKVMFKAASELMEFCANNTSEVHAIYWKSTSSGEPRCAMVFYTRDAAMILGISIDDESLEESFLAQMKDFCNSSEGLILYEQPPPDSRNKFRRLVDSAT